MAEPFRRKRKGKFIGSYRLAIAPGCEVNLETTAGGDAVARAGLAKAAWKAGKRGKEIRDSWGPRAAAAAVVAARAEPPPPVVEESPPPAPPEVVASAPPPPPAPAAAAPPAPEPQPDADAARAAAAAEASADPNAVPPPTVETPLAAVDAMVAELGGADALIDMGAQVGASGLLWLEGKGIEFGWRQAMRKKLPGHRLATTVPGERSVARKVLAAALKIKLKEMAPDAKLTVGWAIVLGLAVGGLEIASTAEVVAPGERSAGEKERDAAAAQAAAADAETDAMAKEEAPPPVPPPSPLGPDSMPTEVGA